MQKLFCNKFVVLAYLLAIVLYTGQGFFFEGTWFTSLAGYLILLTNVYFTCKYFVKKRKDKVLKWMMLFVIWTIIVWFVTPKQINTAGMGIISTLTMVQYTLIIMTTTFTAMAFKQSGVLKDSYIILFYIALFVLLVMNFFFESSVALFDTEATNNLSYPIVSLMPLTIFFWKKKPICWTLIIFILIMSLVSLKRGAIVCCVAFILLIVYMYLKEQGKIKLKTVISLSIVSCVIYYIGAHFLEGSDALQHRIEDTFEGNMSSRDYIYKNIIDRWHDSGLFHQLFGNGPIATTKFGNYAHNDWLEVMYDFGVVGLLFYVLFIFGIFFFWFRRKNTPIQCKCAFILVFSYYVLRSTFSMSFYVLDTILVMFAFGYFLAECNTQISK